MRWLMTPGEIYRFDIQRLQLVVGQHLAQATSRKFIDHEVGRKHRDPSAGQRGGSHHRSLVGWLQDTRSPECCGVSQAGAQQAEKKGALQGRVSVAARLNRKVDQAQNRQSGEMDGP